MTGKILIADDNLVIIDILRDAFEADGYTITVATSGEQALERAGKTFPDCILLDVLMPGMDGFETCRQLKAQDTTREIPVIFMTGLTETADMVKGFQVGGADYVTKPIAVKEIRTRVKAQLRIRELNQQLKEANDYLEKRVKERTAELDHANRKLRIKIKEQQQAEENLRNERERLATVLDSSPIPCLMIDLDHRVVFWNKGIEDLTAIPREQATGKLLFDCVHSIHDEEPPLLLADLILDMNNQDILDQYGDRISLEHNGNAIRSIIKIRKDEKLRTLDVIATRIKDVKGNVVGAIQCSPDITDHQQLQKQLQQAQKMEAIGTLASGIAHDFNNILSSIIGFTELTKLQITANPKATSHLDHVLASGLRAKELVKHLLDFSRRSEVQRRIIDLAPLLKETIKFFRATTPSTITINYTILTDKTNVLADPTQIHQIFMNLFTNAAHAMRDNPGEISILVETASLLQGDRLLQSKDLVPGKYVKLTVSDTGHGIQKDMIGRIFDPFFTTKMKGEGTGLGLSITYGMIKDMKGHISVYSEPGLGTTFQVFLPEATPENVRQEKTEDAHILKGQGNILLVDDEDDIVEWTSTMLSTLGYNVVSRTDAEETLDIFKQNPDAYDLLLTDLTMPKMTGIELAEKISEIRPNLPIIISTGFSEGLQPESLQRSGIVKVVMKPIIASELSQVIHHCLKAE